MGIQLCGYGFQEKTYGQHCVELVTGVATSGIRSRPRTMWASRGVKCLDKHAVHMSWSSPPH